MNDAVMLGIAKSCFDYDEIDKELARDYPGTFRASRSEPYKLLKAA